MQSQNGKTLLGAIGNSNRLDFSLKFQLNELHLEGLAYDSMTYVHVDEGSSNVLQAQLLKRWFFHDFDHLFFRLDYQARDSSQDHRSLDHTRIFAYT